jgi:Holliday junction resolvase RusA-like endonuclease
MKLSGAILLVEPEKLVDFTVPYLTPPSVNHYTRPCMYTGKDGFPHRGKKLTKEAKAYIDAVAIFARGRTVAPNTDSERRRVRYRIVVRVVLGFNQRLDSDNSLKVAIDALKHCGVIHSDAYSEDSRALIVKNDRQNPRTEFLVERMD